jgi:hypothetical protein
LIRRARTGLRSRIRRRLARELAAATQPDLRALGERIGALEAATGAVAAELGTLAESTRRQEVLVRALAAEESANRRRLWELRESPRYAKAFSAAEPLVTVALVTRERSRLLEERSLPAILGQSYERLEILVIGDDADDATRTAVRAVGDERVRFIDLRTRVVREPPDVHWYAAKTLPLGEAYGTARGRWILEADDDDELRPNAVADLLALAREEQAEVAYGQFHIHARTGDVHRIGTFPPAHGHFTLGAALVHSGLRFFAREFHAADLGIPGDWYRAERMLRAGVRFAFLPQPLLEYYPTRM